MSIKRRQRDGKARQLKARDKLSRIGVPAVELRQRAEQEEEEGEEEDTVTTSYSYPDHWDPMLTKSENERTAKKESRTIGARAYVFFAMALAVALVVAFTVPSLEKPKPLADPPSDLVIFAKRQADHSGLSVTPTTRPSFLDLPTDSFALFHQAGCAEQQNTNAETFRSALYAKLNKIPADIRREIVDSAVIDRLTQKGSSGNTVTNTVEKGKAGSYLSFYSTSYRVENGRETYQSCVVASYSRSRRQKLKEARIKEERRL